MTSISGAIKLAAIQCHVESHIDGNWLRVEELLTLAAERGAACACLSALSLWPWFLAAPDRARALAQAWTTEDLEKPRALARKIGMAMVFPFLERDRAGGEALYNSAAVIDRDGSLAGIYRKTHLPDIPSWREKELFTPGDSLKVFETSVGRVGVLICWDCLYPPAAAVLAAQGADWIAAPTSHAFANQGRWEATLTAIAFTNSLFVVRANRAGRDAGLDFYGASCCIGPDGERLGPPMAMNDGVSLWTVDFEERDRVRREWNLAASLRPDLYQPLCATPPLRRAAGDL